MKEEYISGPSNIIRLVDNSKVFYIFINFDSGQQYECNHMDAVNVRKYMKDQMESLKKKKKSYDFVVDNIFMDNPIKYPINIGHPTTDYMTQIYQFFESYPNPPDNFHFHFIDIINKLSPNINSLFVIDEFISSLNSETESVNLEFLLNLSNKVDKLYHEIRILKHIFADEAMDFKVADPDRYKGTINIASKIKHMKQYSDIVERFDTILLKINKFNDMTDVLSGMLDNSQDRLYCYKGQINYYFTLEPQIITDHIYQINRHFNDIYHLIDSVMRIINNMYYLRKFMEHDDFKRVVCYMNQFDAIYFIYYLMHNHQFKITHSSYINTEYDSKNFTKKSFDFSAGVEFLMPPYFSQCSRIDKLPKLFS